MLPTARDEQLLIQELQDETLVYDLTSKKAHCLNPTAALIWRHCDGKTTVPALARLLRETLNLPEDADIVWKALLQLDKARLLREPVVPPGEVHRFSRRDLARKLGAAAILAPVVLSILAPTAAAAGSGAPCGHGPSNCGCDSGFYCASTNGQQNGPCGTCKPTGPNNNDHCNQC